MVKCNFSSTNLESDVHVKIGRACSRREICEACWPLHSLETAIHKDLICSADADRVTALVLLDLSSAFDSVYHDILVSV